MIHVGKSLSNNYKRLRLKPFIMHLKAHTYMYCATRVFFVHYSRATSKTYWVPNFYRIVILCIWDTPSENTSRWQLPNVSSAFKCSVCPHEGRWPLGYNQHWECRTRYELLMSSSTDPWKLQLEQLLKCFFFFYIFSLVC